ncbi:MAG TPA: hypothetical protein VM657_09485 [Sphingomonas sp.]|nr:hypothetical protein [Sphingomonas sp.]
MRNVRTLAHTILVGTIAGSLLALGPAVRAASDHDTASAGDVQQVEVQKSADGKTEYCVRLAPKTGTMLQREVCKTAQEWAKEGVHIGRK